MSAVKVKKIFVRKRSKRSELTFCSALLIRKVRFTFRRCLCCRGKIPAGKVVKFLHSRSKDQVFAPDQSQNSFLLRSCNGKGRYLIRLHTFGRSPCSDGDAVILDDHLVAQGIVAFHDAVRDKPCGLADSRDKLLQVGAFAQVDKRLSSAF